MELAFVIWAVGVLPNFATTISILLGAVISVTILILFILIGFEVDFPKHISHINNVRKISKIVLLVCIPIWVISLLIPDKETSYQMLAAYGVQTIAENEATKELASDGIDVLKALMKKAKTSLETEDK